MLVGLQGCANTDSGYNEACYPVSSRVKKSFLFHHDKCSPHPYRSLEGYQTDLDKLVVKHAARKCANKSLKTLACNCQDKPSKAFRDGYREAYVDIALGESGEVPPVPPEEYWAAHYRTAAGYQEIQEWFTGYKLGAEHAWADGRYEFNQIATPYSLAGWDQPQSDYGNGNADYYQNFPQPEANSNYAPRSPNTVLPPPPTTQTDRPLFTVPQRNVPKPVQAAPQMKQPQAPPVLPRQQIRNQPPIVAPKPPLQSQPAAPAANNRRPEIRHPAPPVYINDDPPPNPYSLQSYPYTPLPGNQMPRNQIHYRQLEHTRTPPRLPHMQTYEDRY
tara:strand:- start:71511 stop:72503 length:993 start_codon:yes stop_codon:yes gene_type:complete